MNSKIEFTTVVQALAVAEHLSFRRAAEALDVCQSSISKRVRSLENRLGVDLFDRHHAGVTVTNAGRHFFEHIRLAIGNIDSAVTSASMAGRVERGSLKIGIFSSLASGFLPELLRAYSTRHPEIDVSIVEGAPSENLALLLLSNSISPSSTANRERAISTPRGSGANGSSSSCRIRIRFAGKTRSTGRICGPSISS
jgi:hypothetical protein